MKKQIITLLICSMASLSYADDLQLQKNHPDRYVVVEGDTLWGIAGKFLKDPWQWPKLWRMNPDEVKNPNKIYPGDVIVLDSSSVGGKQLRLLRETFDLEPTAIVESLERNAIPTILPSVIDPFLSRPLIVEEQQLNDAPEILGAPDGRIVFGAAERVYVSNIREGDGLDWQIYHAGEHLIDPETNQSLGLEAIYLGDARVVRYSNPATLQITRSKQEIVIKDKLMAVPGEYVNSFVPRAPEGDISGRIMSSYERSEEIARDTIVTINRGSLDGLEAGHVLAVYAEGRQIDGKQSDVKKVDPRDHKPELNLDVSRGDDGKMIVNFAKDKVPASTAIKLPDERVGLVMIFRTFDRLSYALVMQSERSMHVNDIVKTP